MLSLAVFTIVGPKPVSSTEANVFAGVPELRLKCILDSGEDCPKDCYESFDFFKRSFYATGAPQPDYSEYKMATISQELNVKIIAMPHYDITELNETYTINVTEAEVAITANNAVAFAHSLASLSQLIIPFDESNPRAYKIQKQNITDYPAFRYRAFALDVSQHYLPIATIQKVIDALAVAKFNILQLKIIGEYSSPINFTTAPAASIKQAAYAPQFTYSMKTIQQLKEYAKPRGVFIMPEISNPNHLSSLKIPFPDLIMKCSGIQMDSINPVENQTQELWKAVFTDLQQEAFTDTSVRHMIHMSNDGFDRNCWEANEKIKAFMKEYNLNSTQVYEQYVNNQTAGLKKVYESLEMPVTVYYEEVLQAQEYLPKDSVIEFESTTELNTAIEDGYYAIRSISWEVDKQFPMMTSTFYYGELWKDLFALDITFNVKDKSKVLGGVGSFINNAGSQNILEHVLPKLLAIGEVLWSNEESRKASLVGPYLQSEICELKRMGLSSGPLWPSAPCWKEY